MNGPDIVSRLARFPLRRPKDYLRKKRAYLNHTDQASLRRTDPRTAHSLASVSRFTMRLVALLLGAIPLLSLASAQKISLKVNLGGGPVGDFLGEEQVLDMSGFSKNIAREPIQNTDQPELFQAQRFSRGADMTFRIPVPDGIYSVTLLFAETFRPACVPGARVFDISLGTPVSGVSKIVDKFDIFQSAGCASGHGKRFDNVPSKEGIVVHLSQHAQHPSLAGFIVEGYPQPKGDGQEYKAIARAPVDPMLGGMPMPGGAPGPSGQDAPISMDSAQGAGMPDMGAVPIGGDAGAMGPPMPGTEHQGVPGPMTGMAMNAPPPGLNQRFLGAQPIGGAQAPMGAIPPYVGAAAPPMGAPGLPMVSVQAPFVGRRRLLSQDNSEEEILAEYHDIPIPYIGGRSREHSRGLKGIPVEADKVRLGKDPDLGFQD